MEAVERLLVKAEEKIIVQSKYITLLEFTLTENGLSLPQRTPSREYTPLFKLSDVPSTPVPGISDLSSSRPADLLSPPSIDESENTVESPTEGRGILYQYSIC